MGKILEHEDLEATECASCVVVALFFVCKMMACFTIIATWDQEKWLSHYLFLVFHPIHTSVISFERVQIDLL